MQPNHVIKIAILALGLTGLGLPAAQAQEVVVPVQSAGEVRYANGGFGLDEHEAMRKLAGDFNLRLMFAAGDRGAFVARVTLVVTDVQGKAVLVLTDAGPLTHVQLPPGKYRVSATYNNETQVRAVNLDGKHPRDLGFRWKATAEELGEATTPEDAAAEKPAAEKPAENK